MRSVCIHVCLCVIVVNACPCLLDKEENLHNVNSKML